MPPELTSACVDFLRARIKEDAHGATGRAARECEAKRKIVEMHDLDGVHCVMCHWEDECGCPTIRALVAVYADHRDHRAEWAL